MLILIWYSNCEWKRIECMATFFLSMAVFSRNAIGTFTLFFLHSLSLYKNRVEWPLQLTELNVNEPKDKLLQWMLFLF